MKNNKNTVCISVWSALLALVVMIVADIYLLTVCETIAQKVLAIMCIITFGSTFLVLIYDCFVKKNDVYTQKGRAFDDAFSAVLHTTDIKEAAAILNVWRIIYDVSVSELCDKLSQYQQRYCSDSCMAHFMLEALKDNLKTMNKESDELEPSAQGNFLKAVRKFYS